MRGQRSRSRFPLPSRHTPSGQASRGQYSSRLRVRLDAAAINEALHISIQPATSTAHSTTRCTAFEKWEEVPTDAQRLLAALAEFVGTSLRIKLDDRALQQARQLCAGWYRQNGRGFQYTGRAMKVPNKQWELVAQHNGAEPTHLFWRADLATSQLWIRADHTQEEVLAHTGDFTKLHVAPIFAAVKGLLVEAGDQL